MTPLATLRMGGHQVPYHLGPIAGLPEAVCGLQFDRFFVVVDGLLEWEGRALAHSLGGIGPCAVVPLSATEASKTLETVGDLAETLLTEGITRQSCVVAVGGALVGNIVGLTATLLFRGMRFVHVPTTLLAMTDSVLSIKQAVNSRHGKNLLGAFHAPELIWADVSFLRGLPATQVRSALCELIKNALAVDASLIPELRQSIRPEADYDDDELGRFIQLCIAAKGPILEEDPHESDRGMSFEYGHTVGHALELASGGAVPHGLAIGHGMLAASRIAQMIGLLDEGAVSVHRELLDRNGLGQVPDDIVDAAEVIRLVRFDNKRGRIEAPDAVPMVLLDAIGTVHEVRGSHLTAVRYDVVDQVTAELLLGARR